MRISTFNNNNNYHNFKSNSSLVTFGSGGKPLKLKYIVENRSYILPERVLKEAKRVLAEESSEKLPSLLEIHKKIYQPLLQCKTLEEAQALFEEFANVKKDINFVKNNHYKRDFEERTKGEPFALKVLKEYWGELKPLKEISESLGMRNRASLDWPLEQINFPKFHNKYKNLLLASDKEGTKVLAKRITDHDKQDNSRREKITEALQARWLSNPDVRQAMSEFASTEDPCFRKVLDKISAGKPLTEAEKRINKGFFKRFWDKNKHLRTTESVDKYDKLV